MTGDYRVGWPPADQNHLGRFLEFEFPSLSWLAATLRGALTGIKNLVGESVAGPETVAPRPSSDRDHSRRLLVQTSPALHARLVVEAAQRGISLNEWANRKLALHANTVTARTPGDDTRPRNAHRPRC
jgi:hypothetical protein